ncbi:MULTISPECIES: hypothetical protein [unclassified Prochlorococcus]|uniref:hypothetical protein n=1 Tax=unclassified Prochlorococcus TaxID=2627481 RepID=UPI000533958E|nr:MULTISPECIES: hypothetical protein [unclassified Prochlorococcus]KGG16150.1 hypothetical protein EV06_0860 [Prochlorococcus sp. MIT 0602]KGG17269.1 hypothetical protein EV07_0707 [Prochlorococcus sp. MIT 0603]
MWNKAIARLLNIDELLLGGASMYEEDLMRIESAEIKWKSKAIRQSYRNDKGVAI